jgi:hypothetical protein
VILWKHLINQDPTPPHTVPHCPKTRAKESVAARVAPKHKRALVRFEQAATLGHVEAMVRESR